MRRKYDVESVGTVQYGTTLLIYTDLPHFDEVFVCNFWFALTEMSLYYAVVGRIKASTDLVILPNGKRINSTVLGYLDEALEQLIIPSGPGGNDLLHNPLLRNPNSHHIVPLTYVESVPFHQRCTNFFPTSYVLVELLFELSEQGVRLDDLLEQTRKNQPESVVATASAGTDDSGHEQATGNV